MKKLIKSDMTQLVGGSAAADKCIKTGELCGIGDICCDKTKGYEGKCPSQEAAKCD